MAKATIYDSKPKINIHLDEEDIIPKIKKAAWLTFIGAVLAMVLLGGFFIVQPGEQALVFDSFTGLKSTVYGEGFHFKFPLIDSAIKMNIRVQKQAETATAASKDLQDVSADVAVNFQIDKSQIVDIYRRLGRATTGEDYMQTQIMNPIVQESVKAITARYTAEELITKRPEVKEAIDKMIKDRMASYNILVTDVSITNFKFSDVFTKAIEEKVTAEQNALKEQNNLKVVQFQAQQKIEAAKGDSEAIRIINEQLQTSPQYVNYLTIQKWNGVMPLSLGSGTLLSINGGK